MVSSGAITPEAFGQFQYPTSPLSVLPHVGKSAAEATAKLVPLQRKAEAEKAARKAAKKEKARKAAAKEADASKGGKPKEDKAKAQAKAAKKATRRKPTKWVPSGSAHASLTQATSRQPCRVTRHAPSNRKPQVTGYVTWGSSEPPSGFEPETYALRVLV